MISDENDPHQGQLVLKRGQPIDRAAATLILVHGRGADAASILALADELAHPDYAYLAPQAAGNTWYPYPFLMPLEQNEPWLSSALSAIGDVFRYLEQSGMPPERVLLVGFSQGACLSLEYAARNARRYGGLVGLSGGLIGPPGTRWEFPGSLLGTPVFLGCSNVDPHIPRERVLESEKALTGLGGQVTTRLYPNLGHMVNRDEIEFLRGMMNGLIGEKPRLD